MSEEKTFKEAYATLQKHAQALRSQQEPDIDNLTTIVSESVEAYRICKSRIDAVEKALEQSLGQSGLDTPGTSGARPSLASSDGADASPDTGGDDDVPF